MVVSLYVDLGIWCEFVVGLVVVLVTFNMEDVKGDGKVVDEGPKGLEYIIVRVE